MNLIFYLSTFFFFIWAIRNALFWVNMWQVKEYRFDRMLVHLKETWQGRSILFSKFLFFKYLAIFSYGFVIFNSEFLLPYQLLVLVIFGFQSLFVFQEISQRQIKRPVLTAKSIFLFFSSLFVLFIFYMLPFVDRSLWFLLIDRLIPLIIGFFVFSLSIPTNIYKDFQEEKAAKKIMEHKKLLVIGVTGSYGKSSTKEYLGQILEKKFRILKTAGSNNTLIGISNTVLSGLKKDTQIFIAEMGAYKRGEISELCQIVHPKIGIITGVAKQHLSLFGSFQNTMDTKYELINSLPKDGLALFNGNNQNSHHLYQLTNKNKILYETLNFLPKDQALKEKRKREIAAFKINVRKTAISFNVMLGKDIIEMEANLVGGHNIENILPGIYIAKYLGMKNHEIKEAVSQLISLPKTMVYQKSESGAVLIDDTFNSNPNAVLAALDYMKIYKGKRILVLNPMVELGSESENEHYLVSREISKVCDYLFLTNKNFHKPIVKGIMNGKGKCVVKICSASKIADYVKENTSVNDIIVFEGKESAVSFSKIL
ncbi:MAG: UDP-N-acetylmuramoyl-tripeptide--D-alanyl-D-alanine ligase [Candidatus Levybacteria bacterium]|nr:UDP-N-acetylmuramoyl-tripeptide--D-alanyl-D-alanine ligase [Candidatus Levybacteria bacterium]